MPGEDKGEHLLPRLRLLQIGDIHLPTAGARQGPLDDKDPAFPTSIRSVIVDQPLQVVFRKLFQLLSNGEIDCALFMGDLTDLGRLEGFEACCKYIATALQLGCRR